MATPSVAMIPSGYKDGTLYNVLPNNAAGDFDVTRGSLATRVNESGLIEPVGTLGADVVLNGDFEETGADQVLNGDFSQEGAEEITNGGFATDSDWTKGAGWSIGGGSANANITTQSYGSIKQNVLTIGKTYKVTFSITSYTSGTLRASAGDVAEGTLRSAIGTYTEYLTCSGNGEFALYSWGDFVGSIDNVSVVEVGQDWTLGTGWSIGGGSASCDGTQTAGTQLTQSETFTNGTTYKITYTITSITAGGLDVRLQGGGATVVGQTRTSNGTYTDYLVSTGNSSLRCRGDASFVGSITNITVEEVGQEWSLSAGCSITAQGARIFADGTNESIYQSNILVNGDTYEMEYEITESVSGSLQIAANFDSVILKNTVGVHKFYAVASANILQIKRVGVTDITIDNIKIKRLNGDDTPRIDYTDGGCPVLLTEPQSTNLIPNSNDFSVSDWQKTNSTISVNSTISPDGLQNADKVVESAALSYTRVRAAFNFTSGDDYTFSLFAKADERDFISLEFNTSAFPGSANAWFDLTSKTISEGGGVNSSKIEDYGNGWFRCSITATADATVSALCTIYISDEVGATYQGDGVSGLYIYGGQIEALSYTTSLIPTYGAVRTRLQDSVRGAGTSSDFNSVEGVLFAEISALADDGVVNRYITINDGSTANGVRIIFTSTENKIEGVVVSGGVSTSYMQYSGATLSETNKIALRYSDSNFTLWVNGSQVASDSRLSGDTPIGLSQVSFTAGSSGGPFFGKTSQVQVFKTALTDAELQTLTTI